MSKDFLNVEDLSKIFNTLFEENNGMVYRRNYNINKNSLIVINDFQVGNIENVLDINFLESKMKSILEQKKTSEYKFIIENYTIIFKEKLKKGEDLEIDLDKIVIYYKGKKSDNINYFIADTLKFNLTKHKYVPHIELVNAPEDIEISKIAKIKNNDPLIKFYGFNKDSVCKITYKSNKINNVKLYFNYRLII